jgi:hypothetical protein
MAKPISRVSEMNRVDSRIHITADHGDDQEQHTVVEAIGGTNKEGITIFLQFTEPHLAGEFNAYQKIDQNLPLSFLMGVCLISYCVVHLSYQVFWRTSNPYYIPGFMLAVAGGLTATLLLTLRLAIQIPTSVFHSPMLRRIHKFLLELDQSPAIWIIGNTTFCVSLSICSSLFMLARVMQGPCDPNNMDWRDQQDCNNGQLFGLPTEEYVINLCTVIMGQVFVKGANRKSLLFGWVGKFAITMACLEISHATTHAFVCFHFATLMFISYEVSGLTGSG